MPHRHLAAILSLLVSTSVAARAASPVLSSLSDPRAVAMGSAGVATAGGVLSSDANPALPALAATAQVQALGPVSKGFHEDSQLWQVGALWPASVDRPYVPAVAVTYREYDLASEFSVRTAFEPQGALTVVTTRTKLTSLVLSLPVKGVAAVGGALRYADVRGVTGWYGDVGVVGGGELHRDERVRVEGTVAVAARQLGDDVETVSEVIASGPDIFTRVGVIAAPVKGHLAWGGTLVVANDLLSLTTAMELVDPWEAGTAGELGKHFGFELDYRQRVALRAGVLDDADFDWEVTYGAGVRMPVASRLAIGVDYAREPALPAGSIGLIDTHAPEASHFFGLRVEYDLR